MLTNFGVSGKTKGSFCGLSCCGNKFGRIDRAERAHNRIKKSRRYAKRVERQSIRREIMSELGDY